MLDDELKQQFMRASFRFKKMNLCFPEETDIPLGELIVMGRISGGCMCAESCVTISDIHEDLYLSKPAVSQILNSLERKGCIHRSIDPDDRRKIAVSVTPEGTFLLEKESACYDKMLTKVFEKFGEENMTLLLHQLETLVDIFESLAEKTMKK